MRSFLSPETTKSALDDGIAQLVVGRSPFELETLRRQVFIEYTNVDMFFSAVETACWDIVGKKLGKPVYELLGGWTVPAFTERTKTPDRATATSIEVAYCLGILSPGGSREHVAKALDEGFSVLKTKAGRDWCEDVARIKAMQDEVDGRLDFRLNPNQRWALQDAVRVGAVLEDVGIYLQYMEQPSRVDAHASLARLRDRTRQPIAPNEDTYIARNLCGMIERGALGVAVVDMTPAGGITALWQLAAIAEDADVPLTHHWAFGLGVSTAPILHAITGIPGFSLPPDTVYYAWEGDVLAEQLTIEDGRMAVPDAPGPGVEVDEGKTEDYRIL